MQWILEQDIFENLDNLKNEIVRQGMSYVEGKCIPFSSEVEWKDKPNSKDNFVYGSLQFAKRLSPRMLPGDKVWYYNVWCNLDQFKCSYYYPRFSDEILQQNYIFLSYGELTRKYTQINQLFGDNVFIRPDSGYKIFTGRVLNCESYKAWTRGIDSLNFGNITPETLCVLSKPLNIRSEYRFIVKHIIDEENVDYNEIITGCLYKAGGSLCDGEAPNLVKSYARKVVNEVNYTPDPFWVLDVAEVNGEFYVLEVNSMSCSGYYSCDLEKIVGAIKEYYETAR